MWIRVPWQRGGTNWQLPKLPLDWPDSFTFHLEKPKSWPCGIGFKGLCRCTRICLRNFQTITPNSWKRRIICLLEHWMWSSQGFSIQSYILARIHYYDNAVVQQRHNQYNCEKTSRDEEDKAQISHQKH